MSKIKKILILLSAIFILAAIILLLTYKNFNEYQLFGFKIPADAKLILSEKSTFLNYYLIREYQVQPEFINQTKKINIPAYTAWEPLSEIYVEKHFYTSAKLKNTLFCRRLTQHDNTFILLDSDLNKIILIYYRN